MAFERGACVLYARCAFCGGIVPLWCAGSFMPHAPVAVAATPMGAYCSMCGVLPPMFACGFCGSQQYLVLPGMTPPAPAVPGMGQSYAPVVHEQPNAPKNVLVDALEHAAKGFGEAMGTQTANAMWGQQG
jgi:hypothetical protein